MGLILRHADKPEFDIMHPYALVWSGFDAGFCRGRDARKRDKTNKSGGTRLDTPRRRGCLGT